MTIKLGFTPEKLEFIEKINELANTSVYNCYQCGKCNAGCPFSQYMDFQPSQIIHLIQLGEIDTINKGAVWSCIACMTCSVRCPKGVDPAAIMEATRRVYLDSKDQILDLNDIPFEERVKLPTIALVAANRKMST